MSLSWIEWKIALSRYLSHFKLWKKRIETVLEGLAWSISLYVIPLALALFSLAALVLWDDLYAAHSIGTLDLKVFTQSDRLLSTAEAQRKLASSPWVQIYDTKLSESPVWFAFKVPEQISRVSSMVEFPERHAISLACWDAGSLKSLGAAADNRQSGSIVASRAGFSIVLDSPVEMEVVCTSKFVGPSRLSAELWLPEQLAIANRDYNRRSGLIDGGLLVLAMFMLVTAVINRQSIYVLFSAWLIVTVRLSATAGGWDDQWLNHAVPQEWLPLGRSITRAAWALLTITLFKALFHDELTKSYFKKALTGAEWLCVLLIFAAIIFPRAVFYPTLWTVGAAVLIAMSVSLVSIVYRTRSHVALWYAASFTVTAIVTLAEIFSAVYGTKGLTGSINGVAAAFASGLLASLAIAEQMRQEHQQRLEAQAELQQTFEAVPVGLFTLDMGGLLLSANPAMLELLGLSSAQALGQAWYDCFSMDHWTRVQQLVHGQAGSELEIHDQVMPGRSMPRSYLVKATLARGKIEGSLQDVTERLRFIDHLQFLADNDSLTRSLNRRGIEKEFDTAMLRLGQGRPLAVAYLDLDRFKLINDLYGRNVGDEVLQHVCTRASNVLSGPMSVGRLGGDEFLLVLPDTKIGMARLICQRIIASLSQRPYDIGDKAFHVPGSIGLIEVTLGTHIGDAISTANRACRQAKKGNGGQLVVYEKGSPEFRSYQAEIELVALLATPAATDRLYLVMQPIMSLSKPHASLNFEVLLRMNGADGKPIRTDRLIQAAESSARMGVIDRWVLSTTLAWLNTHYESLKHTKFICVNLSGASLNDEKFLDDVVTMLSCNRRVAHHLCF
ncbi:MAG: diguanylate cyclase, partial [Betaproteobacteria bacterium]